MNRMIKVGFAAAAIAAASPVFAQDVEEIDEGAVGWTPIALGLASPVQLPWGLATWDVFGIDLNLLYTDAPKMYGLGAGGFAMTTRDHLKGLGLAGFCNFGCKNAYGVRSTLGANICLGNAYGLEVAAFGYYGEFWGVNANLLGALQDELHGVQLAGLGNFSRELSYGWSAALIGNYAQKAYGCQTAALFNAAQELHGCQIALVNYANDCQWGFQIGLVNIIMSNMLKVFPIVNGYF